MGEVIVPVVLAVEDGEGLGDVEVEEAEGWEGPGLVVVAVNVCGKGED